MSEKSKHVTMPKARQSSSIRMAQKLLAEKNDAITKTFVAYANNTKWASINRPQLRKKFANEFVAIHNERVCVHDKDLTKLRRKLLNKHYHGQKSILIDHISRRRLNFLL